MSSPEASEDSHDALLDGWPIEGREISSFSPDLVLAQRRLRLYSQIFVLKEFVLKLLPVMSPRTRHYHKSLKLAPIRCLESKVAFKALWS